VCEDLLYGRSTMTHIASDAYSSHPAQRVPVLGLFLLQDPFADPCMSGSVEEQPVESSTRSTDLLVVK
jgi:hypothetical protein